MSLLLNCAVYLFLLGMTVLVVGKRLPRRWFPVDRFPFKSYRWEKNGRIYRIFSVHRWKRRLPDASLRSKNMVRKELSGQTDSQKLLVLASETCVAELSHWILMVLSLPVLWIFPGLGGRLVLALCIIGNLIFVVIQRYNRPRLLRAARLYRTAAHP